MGLTKKNKEAVLNPRRLLQYNHKLEKLVVKYYMTVENPGIFSGGSTNSVEDRGQRERGSGGGSPLVRGSSQFANE
jgi:hypothetical protein